MDRVHAATLTIQPVSFLLGHLILERHLSARLDRR